MGDFIIIAILAIIGYAIVRHLLHQPSCSSQCQNCQSCCREKFIRDLKNIRS